MCDLINGVSDQLIYAKTDRGDNICQVYGLMLDVPGKDYKISAYLETVTKLEIYFDLKNITLWWEHQGKRSCEFTMLEEDGDNLVPIINRIYRDALNVFGERLFRFKTYKDYLTLCVILGANISTCALELKKEGIHLAEVNGILEFGECVSLDVVTNLATSEVEGFVFYFKEAKDNMYIPAEDFLPTTKFKLEGGELIVSLLDSVGEVMYCGNCGSFTDKSHFVGLLFMVGLFMEHINNPNCSGRPLKSIPVLIHGYCNRFNLYRKSAN